MYLLFTSAGKVYTNFKQFLYFKMRNDQKIVICVLLEPQAEIGDITEEMQNQQAMRTRKMTTTIVYRLAKNLYFDILLFIYFLDAQMT